MEYTLHDFEFYKMYQNWYYHCYYKKEGRIVENDLEVGNVVRVNGKIGIVCGLSGLNRNVYVMSYQRERYWSCRYRESQLTKLDVWEYVNKPEYEEVYRAYVDYVERNHLNCCTSHFREQWSKFQEGRLTEMELHYFHTPPEKKTFLQNLFSLFKKNKKKAEDIL